MEIVCIGGDERLDYLGEFTRILRPSKGGNGDSFCSGKDAGTTVFYP